MSKLIKWTGSKDKQAEEIISHFPDKINVYYEPFLGGGSVFLKLIDSLISVNRFILSDINEDLIKVWNFIKFDSGSLLESYVKHYHNFNLDSKKSDSICYETRKKYYQIVRSKFNISKDPKDFYFLLRTCTNGLVRYNKSGGFNTSCHFTRPGMEPSKIASLFENYSYIFKVLDVDFVHQDYTGIFSQSVNNFMYLDPPYKNSSTLYYGNFDNDKFYKWLSKEKSKWILSYDGKVNDKTFTQNIPINYEKHIYLNNGNSAFRRMKGNKLNNVEESLYLKINNNNNEY